MSKLTSRYPGARPFETEQQLIFKGRKNDTEKLFEKVSLSNLTVLYGKSGTGKSSLLNAGIIPLVKSGNEMLPIRVRFHAYHEGQRFTPPAERARSSVRGGVPSHRTFLDQLIPDEPTLWHDVKEHFIRHDGQKALLLVIDQFEELFTYPEELVWEFAEQLAEAIDKAVPQRYWNIMQDAFNRGERLFDPAQLALLQHKPALKVVLSIRSDRLHLLDRLDKSLPTILKNLYELDALDEDAARQAIAEPAAMPKMDWFDTEPFLYDPAAIEEILDFLQHEKEDDDDKGDKTRSRQKIEATQLQIICSELERRRQRLNLDVIQPDHLGDLGVIIEEYYSSQIAALPPEEQLPTRKLIEEGLVFEEEERRLSLFEGQILKTYQIKPATLRQLVDAHLLRAEPSLSGGYTYELSHDTLVAPVLKAKRLRLEDERRIEEARLARLKEEELAAANAKYKREKRRRQRAAALAWGAGMAAVLAIGAAFYGWRQTNEANEAKAKAEQSDNAAQLAGVSALLQKGLAEAATVEAKRQEAIANQKTVDAEKALADMKAAQLKELTQKIDQFISSAKRMKELGDKKMANRILDEAKALAKGYKDLIDKIEAVRRQ